jgi:hypothetical protein
MNIRLQNVDVLLLQRKIYNIPYNKEFNNYFAVLKHSKQIRIIRKKLAIL